jgi:hypothetical protein
VQWTDIRKGCDVQGLKPNVTYFETHSPNVILNAAREESLEL